MRRDRKRVLSSHPPRSGAQEQLLSGRPSRSGAQEQAFSSSSPRSGAQKQAFSSSPPRSEEKKQLLSAPPPRSELIFSKGASRPLLGERLTWGFLANCRGISGASRFFHSLRGCQVVFGRRPLEVSGNAAGFCGRRWCLPPRGRVLIGRRRRSSLSIVRG